MTEATVARRSTVDWLTFAAGVTTVLAWASEVPGWLTVLGGLLCLTRVAVARRTPH